MLVIKIQGGDQTGKTKQIHDLAMNCLKGNKRCLLVEPSESMAHHVRMNSLPIRNHFGLINVIGAQSFNKHIIPSEYDVILFDEYSSFPANKEGDYIEIATKRIKKDNWPVIAFTTLNSIHQKWVSTVSWWNPLSWGSGYWVDL